MVLSKSICLCKIRGARQSAPLGPAARSVNFASAKRFWILRRHFGPGDVSFQQISWFSNFHPPWSKTLDYFQLFAQPMDRAELLHTARYDTKLSWKNTLENFKSFQCFSTLKNRNPKIERWSISTKRELCTISTKVKTDSWKIMIFSNFSTHPTMVQNLGLVQTFFWSYGSSWGFACT